MKTTLLLTALTARSLTGLAQTTSTSPAPARPPEHLDLTRFQQFDINHDGKLDLKEQEAERASRPAWETEQRARAAAFKQQMEENKRLFDLQRFDANKDGKLDAVEQQARDKWYAAQQKEFLKKYDKNGNGKIVQETRGWFKINDVLVPHKLYGGKFLDPDVFYPEGTDRASSPWSYKPLGPGCGDVGLNFFDAPGAVPALGQKPWKVNIRLDFRACIEDTCNGGTVGQVLQYGMRASGSYPNVQVHPWGFN